MTVTTRQLQTLLCLWHGAILFQWKCLKMRRMFSLPRIKWFHGSSPKFIQLEARQGWSSCLLRELQFTSFLSFLLAMVCNFSPLKDVLSPLIDSSRAVARSEGPLAFLCDFLSVILSLQYLKKDSCWQKQPDRTPKQHFCDLQACDVNTPVFF